MSDSSTGERCDRCGARAAMLYLTAEQELALCGHHSRQHGPGLKAAGFDAYRLDVQDVRDVGASAVNG